MNIKTIVIVCAGTVAVALLSYRHYVKVEDKRLCFERVARAPAERWTEEAKKCAEDMPVAERMLGIIKPGQ